MSDLVTLAEFKDFLSQEASVSTAKDPFLTTCLRAGQDLVRGQTGQNFDQRLYSGELHSGRGKPHIFPRQRPVAATPLPVVTENGAALTVVAGYGNGQVTFLPGLEAVFTRLPVGSPVVVNGISGGWLQGWNNVSLTYTGGFAAADMPADLKLLVCYAGAYVWRGTDRKEQTVKTRGGREGTTTFWEDLPPFYKAILDRFSVPIHGE